MDLHTWEALTAAVATQSSVASFLLCIFLFYIYLTYMYVCDV